MFTAIHSLRNHVSALHAATCPRATKQDAEVLQQLPVKRLAEAVEAVREGAQATGRTIKVCPCIAGVRFRMGEAAWALLGLDDDAYVAETYPSLVHLSGQRYYAEPDDARALLYMLEARSSISGGYDHSRDERRVLRRSADALSKALAVYPAEVTA